MLCTSMRIGTNVEGEFVVLVCKFFCLLLCLLTSITVPLSKLCACLGNPRPLLRSSCKTSVAHDKGTICRSILPFARGCRVGVWVGFVWAALLPAVGTCVVLAFGAMPGRCCFLRVTHDKVTKACVGVNKGRYPAASSCWALSD